MITAMSSHLRHPLVNLLEAISRLNVAGHPLTALDSQLSDAVRNAQAALDKPDPTGPPPDDSAYCIGCGTHPKGLYTCATCSAAEEHEGPQDHVSDWPEKEFS